MSKSFDTSNLDAAIKKELVRYRKSENKNDAFRSHLLKLAEEYPSRLWAIYAPTKKLGYDFCVVEQKLLARTWFNRVESGSDSLVSAVKLCYEWCHVREAEAKCKIDSTMLAQWQTEFNSVLEDFNRAFEEVKRGWDEWDKLDNAGRTAVINRLIDAQLTQEQKTSGQA